MIDKSKLPNMIILNQLKDNLSAAKTPQMRRFCEARLQDYIRSCQPKEAPKRQPNWDRYIPNEFAEEIPCGRTRKR
jgi:hypothetical protein